MPVELRPHQVPVVYEKLHNGCILYGDVGVGKTITSLGYYFARVCGGEINKWGSMQTPKDVYVITTAKVRDSKGFELQAAQYGIHTDPSLSTNGVKITVDSWNNLHKYTEVKDAFFIFDEQRVVGYGAWARAFIKIAKCNEWILLSATPGDTWLDYIPVFIANGWYKHKTDFLDQHVIWTPRVKYPKVLRYQNVGVLVRRRNEVLVHMPYERHTTRHAIDIICDYDEVAFQRAVKKRWHVFEQRPIRDVAELFSVMRKVVNSAPSRLRALEELMEKHPKLIVFYNFDYELEALRSLANTPSGSGEMTGTTLANGSTTPESITASSTSDLTPFQKDLIGRLEALSNSPKTSSSSSSRDSSTFDSTPSNSPGSTTTSNGSAECTSKVAPSAEASGVETGSFAEADGQKTRKSSSGKNSSLSPSSGKIATALLNPSSGSDQATSQDLPELAADAGDVTLGSQSFAIAEWNGHKHEEIPATERWLYLVQYRAGAEGWNCIETDAMVFYSQTYSYRDWWQAHGRIDRLNTPFTDLYYYHLFSKSLIDKAIRSALRVKKNFNEKDLALPKAA